MAENAAAAAAAEAIRAQVAADLRTRSEDIRVAAAAAAEAAHAAAEAAEVLPRFRRLPDDPLLSDHPYGMSNGRPPPPNYGVITIYQYHNNMYFYQIKKNPPWIVFMKNKFFP